MYIFWQIYSKSILKERKNEFLLWRTPFDPNRKSVSAVFFVVKHFIPAIHLVPALTNAAMPLFFMVFLR